MDINKSKIEGNLGVQIPQKKPKRAIAVKIRSKCAAISNDR
jgi:hypothetical protein